MTQNKKVLVYALQIRNLVTRAKKYRNSQDKSLFLNAIYIWSANVLPGLFGAVFWWLASRCYSPSEVGLASAIISAVGLLAMASRLGLDISLIRFLPDSNNQDQLINSVFSFSFFINLVVTGLFLVLIPVLSPKLFLITENIYYSLGFLLLSILLMILGMLRAIFVGKRESKYSLWTSLIADVGRITLVALGSILGAAGIVCAILVGNVFSVFAGLKSFLPRVIDGYKLRFKLIWDQISSIIPYSIGNFLADLVMLSPQTIIPLVIIEILGETSNGHAYIALMMGSMLSGPGLALGRSAFAEGSNRIKEITSILKNAAFTGFFVTLPLAGVTILLAPWILKFFGQSYATEASGLLRWLAAASPIVVIVQIFYTRLKLVKEIKLLVGLSILNVASILLVLIIFLSKLGVRAAGMGVFVGNSLVGIYLLFYYSEFLTNKGS